MQLDSYLEIFTTMYGWAFANIIGDALTGTGLILIPFALIIFNTWREAKESGAEGGGALGMIDAVSTKLVIAMFVFSMCFATSPVTSLLHINLYYTPQPTLTEPDPQPVSRDEGTGSTYDQAMASALDGSFSDSENLSYVPGWWYTVMGVSSGINAAIRAGIQNSASQMRMIEDLARNATIEDPLLLHNVQRFYSECFVPARSRYLELDRATEVSPIGLQVIDKDNADYGPTDVDWMGSQFFRVEPGFYDTMRSYNAVPGFPVDFSRDTEYYDPDSGLEPPSSGPVNPAWGRPTCNQWWEKLRGDLVNHSSTWQAIMSGAQTVLSFTSTDKATDEVAKLAATKANPHFVEPERIMSADYDMATNVGRTVTGALSTFGVGMQAFNASMSMAPLIQGLPMAQALLLMGIYMLLPVMIFFSGYDLRVMMTGGVAIFTVKFFAVLWTIAQWIDANLINAMYPGAMGNVFMQEITQMTSGTIPATYKRMILNTLLMMMFIGLPMLWSAMMGWAGFRLNDGMTNLIRSQGEASESAAAKSGSIAGKIRGR